ncbi:HalOD1 output domain-containing protein [Natronococcus occultus]|uniref:Halobacterial output domain-containing protein n=1 Tax=Natronococcus occultus SP4 TaxID=694430 RepID=L0K586_9EURY|nr:HalOD1 output domain-containing protein [Natronococcus occultus]AGB39710.1 hypothetical protein Natoc_4012 [Natronococcus occultus SP4]
MSDRPTSADAVPSIDADGVGYDPTTETLHARFDPEAESITVSLVEAVATAIDRDPVAMTPLFEAVDPEALSALVASTRDGPVEVSFAYEDCYVTVSTCGDVVIEPPET